MFNCVVGPLIAILFAVTLPAMAFAGILPTREEVLAQVYPNATARPRRLFLTESQMAAVDREAGSKPPSPLVAQYTMVAGGRIIGRAYVDTHVVRTKKESLLICLDAQGSVRRVEATAFREPPEYQASDRWLEQYEGKTVEDDTRLGRDIRPIAGATLTSRAATHAVRRILALDRLLRKEAVETAAAPGGGLR